MWGARRHRSGWQIAGTLGLALLSFQPAAAQVDTASRPLARPKAIEYSNAYGTRLKIHQIGSFALLPLFATEYVVGEKVLNDERDNPGTRSSLRGTHSLVATALGGVFTVTTITGVWNLIEARHDPAGRTRRWVHSIAMLIADGGMVATAASAGAAHRNPNDADHHRSLAIGSMAFTVAASAMMWLWKD